MRQQYTRNIFIWGVRIQRNSPPIPLVQFTWVLSVFSCQKLPPIHFRTALKLSSVTLRNKKTLTALCSQCIGYQVNTSFLYVEMQFFRISDCVIVVINILDVFKVIDFGDVLLCSVVTLFSVNLQCGEHFQNRIYANY